MRLKIKVGPDVDDPKGYEVEYDKPSNVYVQSIDFYMDHENPPEVTVEATVVEGEEQTDVVYTAKDFEIELDTGVMESEPAEDVINALQTEINKYVTDDGVEFTVIPGGPDGEETD